MKIRDFHGVISTSICVTAQQAIQATPVNKSSREIERDERKVIACHEKWQRADMWGRSNCDEEDIGELEGRHSPIHETLTGLRKIRAV